MSSKKSTANICNIQPRANESVECTRSAYVYNDLKYYEDILRASREVLEAVNTAAKRVCNEFEHVILMTQFNVVENHYNVYSIAIRDQVMNALGTVPGHNDVVNVHDCERKL